MMKTNEIESARKRGRDRMAANNTLHGAYAPGHQFHGNQYRGEDSDAEETAEDAHFATRRAEDASSKANFRENPDHHDAAADEHKGAQMAHERAAGLVANPHLRDYHTAMAQVHGAKEKLHQLAAKAIRGG